MNMPGESRKPLSALLLLLLPVVAFADPRVVADDVLAGWGYETTHLGERQTIRRIKPLPHLSERFHPRFDLWVDCFEDNDAALRRMHAREAEIESNRSLVYKSAVGMLVRNECIVFVSAHGTLFMLESQPFIMDRLEEHLCASVVCTRSRLMDDL